MSKRPFRGHETILNKDHVANCDVPTLVPLVTFAETNRVLTVSVSVCVCVCVCTCVLVMVAWLLCVQLEQFFEHDLKNVKR